MTRPMIMSAVVLWASVGGAASVMAADPPGTVFMSPDSGVLVTMPGTDGAQAIVDATAGVASVDIEVVQSIVGSTATQQGGSMSVDFIDSGNFLAGILSINQEAGNMNQQANIRAIAVVDAGGGYGDVTIDINTVQELRGNTLLLKNAGPSNVTIDNSFNNGNGIVGINQAAGNMNQQLNVVAIGIGLNVGPDVVQVGDAQLGQIGTDTDNQRTDDGSLDTGHNSLTNSFNDFSGIAQVSQVTGDMNRVTQVVGVSLTTMAAP